MAWVREASDTLEKWAEKGPWAIIGLVTCVIVFSGHVVFAHPADTNGYVRISAISVSTALIIAIAAWFVDKGIRRRSISLRTDAFAYIKHDPNSGTLSLRVFLSGSGALSKVWKINSWRVTVVIVPSGKQRIFSDTLPKFHVRDNGDIGVDARLPLDAQDVAWLNQQVSRFCWCKIEDGTISTNRGDFPLEQDRIAIAVGTL